MFDRVLTIFRTLLERLLLVWLVLLCWVAYQWHGWWAVRFDRTATAGFDPFLLSAPYLGHLIAVTMLAIGSLLPRDEIALVLARWPTVLGGTAIQYTVMPLLAYGMGRAAGLEGPWMIGIVIVGCVPGAMASNVLTLMARGNVSYSVGLTTSATILSPLAVPLVLWLTLGRVVDNFPAGKVCGNLCWMVVIPVVAGHLASRRVGAWRRAARRFGSIIANLTILWIIAVVVAGNRDQVGQLQPALILALAAVNLGGYAAGFLGGWAIRLPRSMRRALTLEIGMQNAGLGAALAKALFPDDPTTWLPAALYTFGCMFTGTVLARIWAELGREESQ